MGKKLIKEVNGNIVAIHYDIENDGSIFVEINQIKAGIVPLGNESSINENHILSGYYDSLLSAETEIVDFLDSKFGKNQMRVICHCATQLDTICSHGEYSCGSCTCRAATCKASNRLPGNVGRMPIAVSSGLL